MLSRLCVLGLLVLRTGSAIIFRVNLRVGLSKKGDLCFLQKGEVTKLKSLPSGIGTALESHQEQIMEVSSPVIGKKWSK